MDEMSRLQNAYNQLKAMGIEENEIIEFLRTAGKTGSNNSVTTKDVVGIMVLYFRAKKMVSQPHVKAIISKNEHLRGSAACPNDVATLFAYESFVDALDRVEILKGVGSGSREISRTWENYFEELETKYQRDLKNNGDGTRRQIETLAEIQENPFDYRLRAYLEEYMNDQIMNDVAFAINMDPSALAVVKGLPLSIGKSKQESYADVVLKYLYAETSISREKAENLNLATLNKQLKTRLAEQTSVTTKISEVETAILGAMSTISTDVATSIRNSSAEVKQTVANAFITIMGTQIGNGRARQREHEALGREVRDSRRRLHNDIENLAREVANGNQQVIDAILSMPNGSNVMGAIVTNGRARKREHEALGREVRDSRRRLHNDHESLAEQIANEGTTRSNEHGSLAREISKGNKQIIDVISTLPGGSKTMGAVVTNGRARKREHRKIEERIDASTSTILSAIKKNRVIKAVIGSALAIALLGGSAYHAINDRESRDQLEASATYQTEAQDLTSFTELYNQIIADGVVTPEESAILQAERNKLAGNDVVGSYSSTSSIDAMLGAIGSFEQHTPEQIKTINETELNRFVTALNSALSDKLISEEEETSLYDMIDGSQADASARAMMTTLLEGALVEDKVIETTIKEIPESLKAFMNATNEEKLALYEAETDENVRYVMEEVIEMIRDEEEHSAKDNFMTALSSAYSDGVLSAEEVEALRQNHYTVGKGLNEDQQTINKIIEAYEHNFELQGNIETLNQQVATVNELNAQLNGQVSDLETALELAETANATLTSSYATLEAEKNELQNLYDELLAAGGVDDTQIETLKNQIAELETALETAETALEESDAKIAELTEQLEASKTEKETLVAENAQLKTDVESYLEQIEVAEALNQSLQGTVTNLEASVAQAETTIAELTAVKAELQAKHDELQALYDELLAAGSNNEELENVKSQLNETQTKLDSANATITELQNTVAGLKENNSSLTTENAGLKDTNATLTTENAGLKDTNATLTEQNKSFETEVQKFSEQVKKLQEAETAYKAQIAELLAKIEKLESSGASPEQVAELQAKLDEMSAKYLAVNSQLEGANESVRDIYVALGYSYTSGMSIDDMMADIFYDLGIDYREDNSENSKDNPTFGA